MARTVDELLAQIAGNLPGYFESVEPLSAAFAGAQRQAELTADAVAELALFEGASGKWLRLHALGQGVQPGEGEADADLRARLRRVEDKVSKPAILAAADAILAPDTASMVEWWEQGYLDVDLYLDIPGNYLGAPVRAFFLVIPGTATDGQVTAIIDEINRIRAAGVRWWLIIGS